MSVQIRAIRTQRIDLKLKRPIRMSFGEIGAQHVLLVRTIDADGVEGIGEATVMGGPFWNGETIEGTQAVVERYAAPRLLGGAFEDLADYSLALRKLFRGNGAARVALEMSFIDLTGKKSGIAAVELLGGARRTSIPVAWTIASGNLAEALADGEEAILERGHRLFKLKVGIYDPQTEIGYARAIARHFEGRAKLLIDANQAWGEEGTLDVLRGFHDAGVSVVEQPIDGHDPQAMARLLRGCPIPILADEPLTSPLVAGQLARARSASGFVLKPQRDGGIVDTMVTAQTAAEAGLTCYGGTMLETSLGTAALVSLYAAVPDLAWGSELFGPLRLETDIAHAPLIPREGMLAIPEGPGLGIELDENRVKYLEERTRA